MLSTVVDPCKLKPEKAFTGNPLTCSDGWLTQAVVHWHQMKSLVVKNKGRVFFLLLSITCLIFPEAVFSLPDQQQVDGQLDMAWQAPPLDLQHRLQ